MIALRRKSSALGIQATISTDCRLSPQIGRVLDAGFHESIEVRPPRVRSVYQGVGLMRERKRCKRRTLPRHQVVLECDNSLLSKCGKASAKAALSVSESGNGARMQETRVEGASPCDFGSDGWHASQSRLFRWIDFCMRSLPCQNISVSLIGRSYFSGRTQEDGSWV
jgi:hypothetical protein